MNWWDILKNARVSNRAEGKGTSLDASKININFDKKDCKEKLLQYIKNSKQNNHLGRNFFISQDIGTIENKKDWKDLTEKQACDMIRLIDDNWVMENETMLGFFKDINFKALNSPNILDIKVGQYTFRRFIKGETENSTRKLYISYGFSLTENLTNNAILPSTWGIMGTFGPADWPMGNFDWRK
tara:strand:+ start:3701 stop:4252 length:552 start_codon:yes stop_codon:yes gene_type:complete